MKPLLALIAMALASPAAAHHRQTPPEVALTLSGNTLMPRIAAPGSKTIALAVQFGAGHRIVSISPWKDRKNPAVQTVIAEAGDHANPAVSVTGRSFTFDSGSDPLGSGLPGRQVIAAQRRNPFVVSNDPTGTSINPSIDTTGNVIAFESTADLAGTGNPPGVRQVFVRERDGSIRQLSKGVGTSRNVIVSPKQRLVLFESSSEPITGADTGVAQIWVGDIEGTQLPITAGLGPSVNPAISNDGRIVAFESTADLAGTQKDTGVSQVYMYDTKSKTYARITNDPGGCTLPSSFKVQRDWRVAYVCGGLPYFTMLRADQRYLVQAADGVTQRVLAELGIHFLVLSTTADLINGSGTTAGSQVYLVNLFKRSPVPVAGSLKWFPSQGLPPL